MPEEQTSLRKNSSAESAAKSRKTPLTPALSPPRGEGVKPLGDSSGSGTRKLSAVSKGKFRTRTEPAKNFARQLRHKATDAEKRLWRLLRDRRFNEFKFRRQYPVGVYFLDFYCPDARLAVELDGSGHGFPDQKEKDTVRDQYLASQGIKVMRLWNNQLSKELATIRETIWYELMERTGRKQEIAHYLRLPKQ